MADFPAVFQISSLDGTNGFRIDGRAPHERSGFSVSWADINGDGIDDLIVGARNGGANGVGATYVLFGSSGGFSGQLNLSDLDGANGFRMLGAQMGESSGRSVAGAGDVNGDGLADLIIGAPYSNVGGAQSGVSYVVFGTSTGFAAEVALSGLNGANGFRILGETSDDNLGWSVASAGDVNSDGIDDLVIGAKTFSAPGAYSGATYVLFGRDTAAQGNFLASLNPATLDGSNGFRISGEAAEDRFGYAVSSAGDVNGDGIADLVVGSREGSGGPWLSGAAYVVFGSAGGFAADLNVTSLNGTNGLKIDGGPAQGFLGASVASAGDVNGDGVDDLIVGARYAYGGNFIYGQGASFVVFGRKTAQAGDFGAVFDLSTLDGDNGFRIFGHATGDQGGYAVASAGDLNGDGIGDLVVGAPYADADRDTVNSGRVFVVYGSRSGFDAALDVASLDGTNGFTIEGLGNWGTLGWALSAGGDINGDGLDDLAIGAPQASPAGRTYGGFTYVIYGRASGPVIRQGTAGDDSYDGGGFDDDLSGQDGADVLNGEGGDDVLNGGDGTDTLDGGEGADDIDGGLGADQMTGGLGDDVFHVDDAGDVTSEEADEGTDTVRATINVLLGANLERLILEGAGDINGTGNGLANVITGNGGANVINGADGNDQLYGGGGADDLIGGTGHDLLDGGTGADEMAGGTGDDTYYVDDAGDVTVEVGGEGSDVVRATVTVTLGANIETLVLEGTSDIGGTGNSGANTLNGNAGNNTLSGGGGNDLIKGGAGDDVLNGGFGADQLLGGDGTDGLDGAEDNDRLEGGDGNDTILGGTGADILDGGADNDSLTGGIGADQLLGGAGTDTLDGGADNDILNGGLGADTMTGGGGDDVFYIDDAGDTALEASGEGTDTVRTLVTFTLGANIERLILEGGGDLGGTGNALANVMTGNAGANTLSGGDGADMINGGLGNDTLNGDAGADNLTGGDGDDTVHGGADNDTINGNAGLDTLLGGDGNDLIDGGADADLLWGDAGADTLNGGAGGDILRGGTDNDVLNGGADLDLLIGGAGDDTYIIDADNDSVVENTGEGTDTVRASVSYFLGANLERLILEGSGNIDGIGNGLANVLTGNAGANTLIGADGADILNGGLGNDVLIGGLGADIMSGGGGADRFWLDPESIYSSAVPTGRSLEIDTVGDFSTAQGDTIDVSYIDAVAGGEDDAFTLVGSFSNQAGQLVLTFAAGTTTLSLDVDGDGRADYQMRINGDVRADSGGWML